jgi:hypothetical protein
MNRLAKLQLIGPIVLALTIIVEELATYALALKPSWSVVWYLNIELFGIFQRSHYVLSDNFGVPYFQLLFVAVPILLLTSIGIIVRRPLMISVATNLSFIYALFLAYSWHVVEQTSLVASSLADPHFYAAISLSALALTSGPHMFVLMAMLFSSLLSSAVSHLLYIRAVRQT